MIADDARALFASEVDRSGPYKGTVTNRHVWAEILEKRATAKKLLTIARRRGA